MIGFIDDAVVPTAIFLKLLADHELGEGETESIATCVALGYGLCCDDKKARFLGETVLGKKRITGSIRVLRWCVEEKLILCGEAFNFFGVMRSAGGFLPKMPQVFFCSGILGC
jgi:predicted nucleic acid-binding protein